MLKGVNFIFKKLKRSKVGKINLKKEKRMISYISKPNEILKK